MHAHDVLDTLAPSKLGAVAGGARPRPAHHAAAHPAAAHPASHPSSAANNRTSIGGNIGVTARGIQVGVQGHYDTSRSNYAACVDRFGNLPLNDYLARCGRP